jgi:hypothetical protein
MTPKQLTEYDHFLDENDWDIYYWATQEPTPTSHEAAEGGKPEYASSSAQGKSPGAAKQDEWVNRPPIQGEWAQTVGNVRAAYRPVPQRWQKSEILALLRQHVKDRSAGGVQNSDAKVEGEGLNQSVRGTGGGGIGRMPEL